MTMPNDRAQYEAEQLGVTIVEDLKVLFAATMANAGPVKCQTVDQITSIEGPPYVFNGDAPNKLDEDARSLIERVSALDLGR